MEKKKKKDKKEELKCLVFLLMKNIFLILKKDKIVRHLQGDD